MDFAAVRDNVVRVQERIAAIQGVEGGEGSAPVRIVAVTKGHGAQAVRAAAAAGLTDVGENRVQEALAKQDAAGDVAVRWHLIGHLQTNKAKLVPGRFAMVQSIDSVRVATALDRALRHSEAGRSPVAVLIEVNVAGESQKTGCAPEEAGAVLACLMASAHLKPVGLMTMAPFTDDVALQRRVFAGLRTLRDALRGTGAPLDELSMGMSDDYEAAVAEGATIVRLGTVLFGTRM